MNLTIQPYEPSLEEKWDKFVMTRSYNGTFQQTRNFLNYHPSNRFVDASLVVWKGTSDILAVIPAAMIEGSVGKCLASHPGATFGGITINEAFYNIEHVEAIFDLLEDYLLQEGFDSAIMKQPSDIFATRPNDLLEYFFFQRGWRDGREISFVIDFQSYDEDILSNFSSSRRRDYKYGEKSGLTMKELESPAEIALFHDCLAENLQKHNARPVHTCEELLDFKNERLKDVVSFYGVFHEEEMVSASMVFRFKEDVFHTQYLAARQDALNLFPNNFMDTKLIELARDEGFHWFSFGISTEDHGHFLNQKLARFKEGFGTTYSNNQTFTKLLRKS